jgi:hypothetical protein
MVEGLAEGDAYTKMWHDRCYLWFSGVNIDEGRGRFAVHPSCGVVLPALIECDFSWVGLYHNNRYADSGMVCVDTVGISC